MKRRRFDPRSWIGSLLVAAAVFGVATFDVGSAASIAQTANDGNSINAQLASPPTDVAASMSLRLLPLPPTCRGEITWSPSPATGVTAYEIRRVAVLPLMTPGGPWTVSGTTTSYTDSRVPLVLLGGSYEWQVRALVDGWPSEWVPAVVDNFVACLL